MGYNRGSLYISTDFTDKGNKISKRPPILVSSSSRCQKWQQKSLLIQIYYSYQRNLLSVKVTRFQKEKPPILISSSSRCQKWQQKITPRLNLPYKFKQGVIFCCCLWHQLDDGIKIEGLSEILLPLPNV